MTEKSDHRGGRTQSEYIYKDFFGITSIGSEFVHRPEFVHNGEKNTVTQNPFFGSNDFSSVTEHP